MQPVAINLQSLHRMVGDTPLIEITCRLDGHDYTVYAKHEISNFTGSTKDRMALHIMEAAYERRLAQPGDVLAEATSGNTGIAFAALGRALGHPVRIYMPDWMSRERVLVIQSLGAEIIPVSRDAGGFLGAIEQADRYAEENEQVFRPQQFDSESNPGAHERTTGPEILEQLDRIGKRPTAFVAGVGTGGTVMGVAKALRGRLDDVAIHPLEPANSPTLRTGKRLGHHRIQGISDEFIPSIVHLDELDDIIDAWDGDSILMAQRIAAELGIGVGISSGANVLGALQVAREQGPDSVVTTVLPDSNKKYLSTDLCRDEPVEEHYLTPKVEFVAVRVLPRLGHPPRA